MQSHSAVLVVALAAVACALVLTVGSTSGASIEEVKPNSNGVKEQEQQQQPAELTESEKKDLAAKKRAMQLKAERMRERLEKENERKRILELAEKDKGERKHRFNYNPIINALTKPLGDIKLTGPTVCKLTLVFPDETFVTRKYSPRQQLGEVRAFVGLERRQYPLANIEFIVTRADNNLKQLQRAAMNETLGNLELCPEAQLTIIVN